jgi:hypothetical protein
MEFGGRAFPQGTAEITSWMDLQHVGTKLCLANDAFWHEKPCRWKKAEPMALARFVTDDG